MGSGGPIEVSSFQESKVLTVGEANALSLPTVLEKGLDFWLTVRGERRFPTRDDIDPLDLRDLLPSILLWEVVDAPRGNEFVVRVAGSNATLGGSRRFKGYTLIDFHGDRFAPIWEEFNTVRTEGVIHYACRMANWDGLPNGTFQRLLFPFGEEDTVTHLMSVISFEQAGDV